MGIGSRARKLRKLEWLEYGQMKMRFKLEFRLLVSSQISYLKQRHDIWLKQVAEMGCFKKLYVVQCQIQLFYLFKNFH